MTLRYWADLKTTDFAALDPARTVAVLPLGATEQHGPHLPLSVDHAIVDGLVRAAAPRVGGDVPVLVLPTQAVGYSIEHASFAGTLTLPVETVLATWIALGECVARAGLRKLLLFNAHGGHVSLMDIAARELRGRAGLIVYSCSFWNLPMGEAVKDLFTPEEHRFGVHGGAQETSLMLALRPSDVAMEHARNFGSTSRERAARYPIVGNGTSAKLGWHIQDYNPAGAAGDAASASAEKGRQLMDDVGGSLAGLLHELSDLPLSTVAPNA